MLILALVGLDRRFDATIGNPGDGGSFLQVPVGSMVSFLVAFSIGMALHTYRDRIPLLPVAAWLLVGLYIAGRGTVVEPVVLPFMAGYGALVLAGPAGRLRLLGARQLRPLHLGVGLRTQLSLTAVALPVTYLCGWLSWRYIEAPTLALRRYLPRADRPPAPPRTPERKTAVPATAA